MKATKSVPLIALLFCAPAMAQETTNEPQQFVNMVKSSNMFEIQSSELALNKAQTAPAKEFAQHMISDHTKAGEEMLRPGRLA